MQSQLSKFTYKGVSFLPFLSLIPVLLLTTSTHWSYDEAWTYVSVLDTNAAELIAYEKYKYANNHILNTLYFYFLEQMGVTTMFLYRLPGFLSFFLYFYFVSRLLKERPDYKVQHIDQLVFYLWPYSIYFAQGRSYGPALACFAGALLFYRYYLDEGKVKHLLYFILLGGVASLSIFSFIFPVVAMVMILGLSRFKEIIKSPVRILVMALFLPVLWYVFDKGKIVNEYDVNIIGSDSLFKGGTFSSLISFLSLNGFAPLNTFLVFKAILIITLVPVLYVFAKKMKYYRELTIIIVTVLLFVVSHYLLGAQYPMYRGVAYIIFLFYLALAYSNFKRNIFITAHFAIVVLVGCWFLWALLDLRFNKGYEDVLAHAAKEPGTIVFEDIHRAGIATNHMWYNDTLDIVDCRTDSPALFDNAIDTARYVVCRPARLEATGKEKLFERMYPVATFFYFDKVFYRRKEQ